MGASLKILMVIAGALAIMPLRTAAYTSQSDKAKKHFDKAVAYYEEKNSEKAVPEAEQALKADSNFVEAHMLMASIYTDIRKPDKAIFHYKKAVDVNAELFPKNLYFLGKLELGKGFYNDAKKHLSKFVSYSACIATKITAANLNDARKLLEQCDFAINALNNPIPFVPQNLGDGINTTDGEYFPTITADEQTLYFTKQRVIGKQEDIYVSTKQDGKWQLAVSIGEPINTKDNEGALCISPDGKYLFFTACGRSDGFGDCDIYMSEKNGDKWSVPVNMGASINSRYWESQPSFSSDGKTLYFVSTRPGGMGNYDIWKSVKNEDGSWLEAVNLGDKVNTFKSEMTPFIHSDNKTLYFASSGHTGLGGYDVFRTQLNDDGTWNVPKNLGYPINSIGDERSFMVNPSGTVGYISSDRIMGKGDQDIYTFELYESARPTAVTYLKGRVRDKNNQAVLAARFELIDIESGKIIVQSVSDSITGGFLVCVPFGKEYVLNVSRAGYLFYSDNIIVKDIKNIQEPFLMDLPLHPIKIGETVVLKNIFFDSNSFEIKSLSNVELNKLVSFMKANPSIHIEISGHTDNTGDRLKNIALSEKRAKMIFQTLSDAGIPDNRVSYKGYGELKPVAKNVTEEGKAKNRRTEFTVIQ